MERLAHLPQHSEPAGHGQSSALLGPPLCCCSPSLLLALGPQLPSHSPLPTVPSYTSASTTSLGSRSLLAFIHLRDPSVCASVPRSLGASCLRVSVPQGPLSSGPPGAAQPLPYPHSPSLGLPPLQGRPSPTPSRAAAFLSISTPFLGPILSLWGGAEDPRGAALPPRTDADPAAPWRGGGAPVFRDGRRATPAWPRVPAGPADTVAAERGWLWRAGEGRGRRAMAAEPQPTGPMSCVWPSPYRAPPHPVWHPSLSPTHKLCPSFPASLPCIFLTSRE